VASNVRDGIEAPQPRDLEERAALARECAARLGLTVPILLDGMENRIARAYGAWPERLYVISREGRIVYRGGKGPYGFDPDALAAFLDNYLAALVAEAPRKATSDVA
jgi:type I thyroxine 5'-deiodinase